MIRERFIATYDSGATATSWWKQYGEHTHAIHGAIRFSSRAVHAIQLCVSTRRFPVRFKLLQCLHVVFRERIPMQQFRQKHGYDTTCAATCVWGVRAVRHCEQCVAYSKSRRSFA